MIQSAAACLFEPFTYDMERIEIAMHNWRDFPHMPVNSKEEMSALML